MEQTPGAADQIRKPARRLIEKYKIALQILGNATEQLIIANEILIKGIKDLEEIAEELNKGEQPNG